MYIKNDRLIRALLRQPVDTTPVWIMRQAGRYLPEYRELRKQAGSFMGLCQNPELACEVSMQPVRRFDLDAAILFSDILTIPDAMGLGLHFIENEGPCFKSPVRSKADIEKLVVPDPEQELRYVTDAVRQIKKALNDEIPLIGFAGSPWTIATYMIEGRASKEYGEIKGLLFNDPAAMHLLLEKLSVAITEYLNAQIEAGVNVVQIFDTWGGVLSPAKYREFSLQYMQKIVEGLVRQREEHRIPVILFSKGCAALAEDIANTGCDAMGVDWTSDLGDVRQQVGDRLALQGNLDPGVLYAEPDVVRQEVEKVLDSFGQGEGHVFNLGHGIHQKVNPDNVTVLVNAVHELSKPYHS